MKELAVHCTLYFKNPVGDDPYSEAHETLNKIRYLSAINIHFFHGLDFDYDIDYAEVKEDD